MDENRRIEFSLNGRDAVLICPDQPAPGMPWVWRAEFLGAFDYADRALLARGWHVAYLHASDLYGCPEAVEAMYGFYRHLTAGYALSRFPVLFGFSRGGLYAVNFALAHPGCFAALYLDAPVLEHSQLARRHGQGRTLAARMGRVPDLLRPDRTDLSLF